MLLVVALDLADEYILIARLPPLFAIRILQYHHGVIVLV